MTSRRPSSASLAAVAALLVAAGCGGGDPLPATDLDAPGTPQASPTPTPTPTPLPGPTPTPEPTPSPDARALVLSGITVEEPYRLVVDRREEAAGVRYRVEIDALNWEVELDVDTWELSVPVTDANLTSDALVPDGAITIRRLVVNGARLGTTGTALDGFDRCAGTADDEEDGGPREKDERNRQGLVYGRFWRLDTTAEASFTMWGTDDRCNAFEGTIFFRAPVQ